MASLAKRKFDVVIVGAGGSGMRASLQLALAGLNVAVRLAEPHSLPRSEGKAKRVWDERQDSQ